MHNPKILIIDDIPENLFILTQILKEYFNNCIILQAEEANDGIKICFSQLPDLIITDWDMPYKSGIDLIKYIKNSNLTQNIPIIITTGIMTSSDNLKEALEAGAVDYLRKPVNDIELFARAKSALLLSYFNKKNLDIKNHELTLKAINITQNQNLINKISKKISNLKQITKSAESMEIINSICEDLLDNKKKNSWEKFNKSFETTHGNFQKQIIEKHPNITNSELKLCNLILLGISSKKIADILHQTEQSVRVARSRLRKKFNISKNQNLELFLKNL